MANKIDHYTGANELTTLQSIMRRYHGAKLLKPRNATMACSEKNYWFQPTSKSGINDTFPAGPHPVGFTGKKGEGKTAKHYYKGEEWTGHTGFIGRKDWPQIVAKQRASAAE